MFLGVLCVTLRTDTRWLGAERLQME